MGRVKMRSNRYNIFAERILLYMRYSNLLPPAKSFKDIAKIIHCK